MKILNLTQHKASPEQLAQGVVDHEFGDWLTEKLTFDSLPAVEAVLARASEIATKVAVEGPTDIYKVMVGGAPFFMVPLEDALTDRGFTVLYAFSKRVSVESPDGVKTSKFVHEGFVEGTL